jgi:hypothetical protein
MRRLVKETVGLLETSSNNYLKKPRLPFKNFQTYARAGPNNPHPYLLTSKAYISQ